MVTRSLGLQQVARQQLSQSLRQLQVAAAAQEARFLELSEDHTEAWVGWQLRANPALRRRVPNPRAREIARSVLRAPEGADVDSLRNATGSTSLEQHLLSQLGLERTNDRERAAAEVIILNLDRRGFLTLPLHEVARLAAVDEGDAEDGQAVVMGLEPEGCGASDLHEYLVDRVRQEHRRDADFLRLVGHHLDDLRKGDLDLVARLSRVPRARVDAFAEVLRSIPPFPAIGYGISEPEAHIVPTLEVLRDPVSQTFRVEPLEPPRTRVEIDRSFEARLAQLPPGPERDAATTQLQAAQDVVRQLAGRYDRVLEIARIAVAEQRGWFEHGPEAMRNLTMETIATRLSLPRPTVSRAVKGRYFLFEGQVRPLRELFSHRSKPGRASQGKLHALIGRIIATEDPRHPMSDASIAEALRVYGLREARRTVAKHRERAGIPPMLERRRQAELGRERSPVAAPAP